jgi:single-stranded DNA-specific DHH superfamily exonuclease
MTPFDHAELEQARKAFDEFVGKMRPTDIVVVLADGDADGLGAATVLLEALGAQPGDDRFATPPVPKGLNAFTPTVRDLVQNLKPDRLIVLDLGVRDFEIAPGIPTLVVDHHRPLGHPPNTVVITGYSWNPVPTSSLLAYLLCHRAEGIAPNAWKAAMGNAADLGPEYEPFTLAAKAQKQKWMKEALSLVNTAKRSSDPDRAIPAALRLLREAKSAQEISERDDEPAHLLKALRQEVRSELSEARRVGPRFSKTEPIAMIRYDSPARIQPLLAQSWKGRIPKYVAMAVNGGYLPGRVNFSLRTDADINLLDLLARHGAKLGIDEPEYGLGHDKATGGSLPTETFERLLKSMGFAED